MFRLRWLLFSLALMLGARSASCAEDAISASPRIETLDVGLGGGRKVGNWLPVFVRVKGGSEAFSGRLVLRVPDSDGVPAKYEMRFDRPLELAPKQNWSGWRYLKVGRVRAEIHASLRRTDGHVVHTRTLPHLDFAPSARQWVVSAGADVGIDEAARLIARRRGQKLLTSRLRRATQFPDRWYGYEGVDVLLVCTGKVNLLEELSERQFAALSRWIQLGGRVVFSAARKAAQVFGREGRFKPFRPGDFLQMDPYWRASGLEQYARANTRLLNPDQVALPVFEGTRGRVLCYEGIGGASDRPLCMRYPFGFGQITYLPIDLDLPPLASWSGRPKLLARLLLVGDADEEVNSGTSELGRVANIGFDDLIGQLRGALDQFTGITLAKFSWIAGLLIVYIVLIGPVDFFVLRRWNRPHWTWLTFPLIVLAFSALAVLLSRDWKGNRLSVNQADIVDLDLMQGVARGTTWFHVYSPRAIALDTRLTPPSQLAVSDRPRVLLSWQGLPGTGLGGMNTTASIGELSDTYAILGEQRTANSSNPQMAGVPIHTSSTKSLIGRWWSRPDTIETFTLSADEGGLLHGRVINPLKVELSHCAVYYENWAYRFDRRLQPGDSADLKSVSPLDLKWQLTRRQLLASDDQSTAWSHTDFDNVPRILEMLMFYGAANGSTYTRLHHRYQAFLDLSEHLWLGRAILVGFAERPACRLQGNGRDLTQDLDKHWTCYRIVIPVNKAETLSN